MTDKQIKKLNELTEMSQELGLYEDRPDWRITLQADHIKRLEEALKAKEQECGQLKCLLEGVQKSLEVEIEERSKWSQLETEARFELVKTQQQLDQLKAENDELKKKCNIYTCGICGNKEDCNKLYKTLTEIKEIIHFNKTNRLSGGACISIEQILQKISEVSND